MGNDGYIIADMNHLIMNEKNEFVWTATMSLNIGDFKFCQWYLTPKHTETGWFQTNAGDIRQSISCVSMGLVIRH